MFTDDNEWWSSDLEFHNWNDGCDELREIEFVSATTGEPHHFPAIQSPGDAQVVHRRLFRVLRGRVQSDSSSWSGQTPRDMPEEKSPREVRVVSGEDDSASPSGETPRDMPEEKSPREVRAVSGEDRMPLLEKLDEKRRRVDREEMPANDVHRGRALDEASSSTRKRPMTFEEERKLSKGKKAKSKSQFEEYPITTELQDRCVNMVARLFNAPIEAGEKAVGAGTVGSSEAIMLAGLAFKRKWQNERKAAGLPWDKPSMVTGANVQVTFRLEGMALRYWFCSSVGFSSSQEGLQECVLQYELTVAEEAETCQPIVEPLQDPASKPKEDAGRVEEARKNQDHAVLHEETASERPVVQEKSTPARQVSPEKQLRAALLKGRFADFIRISQEKSLPDNKAAEAMKRKLEKQKREVERDEARRTLQRTERTVEIDENSAILNDLERLRSSPVESMLGSAYEAGDHES